LQFGFVVAPEFELAEHDVVQLVLVPKQVFSFWQIVMQVCVACAAVGGPLLLLLPPQPVTHAIPAKRTDEAT
jgi:hypothetical protein